MQKTILGQVLSNTRRDSQGEQLSPEDLHAFLNRLPARMPLHQHHDNTLPICGEMTNFRILPDPEDPKHLVLVCDVTYDDEKIQGPTAGFSWSAVTEAKCRSAQPAYSLYLPFPLYNDQRLIDTLMSADPTLAVGKYVKKNTTPALVALLVFAAKPLWDTIYKQLFEEQFVSLIRKLRPVLPDELAFECAVEVPVSTYRPRPQAIFALAGRGMDAVANVPDGLEAAKSFCESDFLATGKSISRVRMSFQPESTRFVVLDVRYVDGTHRSFS